MIELNDRLYTSTEVAEILGVSLRSVYRYLEEGKLNAEVKTATGRHRFTKTNILEFLYPEGVEGKRVEEAIKTEEEKEPIKVAQEKPQQVVEPQVNPVHVTQERSQQTQGVQPIQTQANEQAAPKPQEPAQKEEEPVDWLAKFREAAAKFKEEEEVKVSSEPAFVQDQAVTGIGSVPQEQPKPKVPEKEEETMAVYYYRSGLGGLKDIAQNIDKHARVSNLPYAFTLNAGLSLYKPIQPFSVLHVYTRSGDKAYFEKALQLTPTDEASAQLAVILSDDSKLYSGGDEVHGLYVVSKSQLAKDIQDFEMADLAKEATDIIG